ncbi:MAG: thiamine pyrophosphate-dependent dehydrogenase E1 component subunit alpha [Caldilineae bacterium]|nr:MAG: thiamine pyrophosphate-dependent dehydrogenase E1 component subunit alpha [Caldilineae bacterium]
MLTIRRVEEELLRLFSQGHIRGTVHTYLGQEACAVGVVNALDRGKDVIFSNHRAHGHFLAYCDDVEGLMAEVMGRAGGVCGGVGGTQHLHKRNLYTNGIQGGIVPLAVGSAAAEKFKGSGAITVVFLGDGTLGQGVVYESLNIASLWSLPVLFVVENNHYAQTTPYQMAHAGDLSRRARPFDIRSAALQADDVFRVHTAAAEAVEYVRGEGKPFFLYLETYRLGPHSKGDDLRDPEEIAAYRARDPLIKLRNTLPPAGRDAVEQAVSERVARTVAAVLAQPLAGANP